MDRPIPKTVSQRLSGYLRFLERLQAEGRSKVSSREMADALGRSAAQVRRDLAYFGQFGSAGIGYPVPDLAQAIRRILGTDRAWRVAVVGVGNLGSALARFQGFPPRGFRVAALLDKDRRRVGATLGGVEVEDVSRLEEVIRREGVELVMVCVPAEEAQAVVDRAAAAGVRGILNFAPVRLSAPPGVAVESADLVTYLERLSFAVALVARPQ